MEQKTLYSSNKSYKLYDLFDSLSKLEVKQLKKFLQSPFFTTREDILNLYLFLTKRKLKNKDIPSQEQVFKSVFPNKKWNSLLLRGTMSDLLELIEEYLLIQKNRQNKIQRKLQLSEIYRKRKLSKNYQSNAKTVFQLLNHYDFQNEQYFQLLFDHQNEQVEFHSSTKRTENLFLQEISDTQDVLYLIRKLRNACAQISHKLVFKQEYDFGLLKPLLNHIENEQYIKIPAIALFYYCFKFLTERDQVDYFYNFKFQLKTHKALFTSDDLAAPYRLALNYCIRKMNEGNDDFVRDAWELYIEGIEQKILLEDGVIPRFTFNNMIALALILKEYDWINEFIKNSAGSLSEEFRNQTISFNLARVAFDKSQFNEALVHLQSSEYKDLVNILISKVLLVKIYFELNAFNALESHLDSFQQFIRRKEVSDYHRTNFLNVIRFVRKILSIAPNDKDQIKVLKESIESELIVSEKEWLLKKISY